MRDMSFVYDDGSIKFSTIAQEYIKYISNTKSLEELTILVLAKSYHASLLSKAFSDIKKLLAVLGYKIDPIPIEHTLPTNVCDKIEAIRNDAVDVVKEYRDNIRKTVPDQFGQTGYYYQETHDRFTEIRALITNHVQSICDLIEQSEMSNV